MNIKNQKAEFKFEREAIMISSLVNSIESLALDMVDKIYGEKTIWKELHVLGKEKFPEIERELRNLRSGYIFRKDPGQTLLEYLMEWIKSKKESQKKGYER